MKPRVLFTFFLYIVSLNSFAGPIFIPYSDLTLNTHWDSNYQAMEPQDLALLSKLTGTKNYRLAFITDAGSCVPAWGAQTNFAVSQAWGKHLTDKLKKDNITFDISLGGASGNDLSSFCNPDQLVNAYQQIINTYGPNGLDFDIENNSADVLKIMNALKKIQTDDPDLHLSFTLPVLPEGLIASGEDIIQKAKAANLQFSVNIMAMDYGPAYSGDMGQYAISAANHLANFLQNLYPEKNSKEIWQMIEVTPMIGVNDVNTEQFTLKDVDVLKNYANSVGIRALSMWSVSRDNPCADQWASPICSGKNLQARPGEYQMRFN